MNAIYAKRESTISIAAAFDGMQCWIKDRSQQAIDFVRVDFKMNARLRTIDRVMLSLWLSLPFMLLVSSDWIGMVILWQALSAAARLRHAIPVRIHSSDFNQASINERQSA
jgi:hypothetical protein